MPASHLAHSGRVRLCDLLIERGEAAPTLCEGWLTRDLAAHLFVRERRPAAMPGILLGGRLSKLTNRSMAAALRRYGYAGLVAKVRAGPPLLWRPLDDLVNLVEYFVHTEDVRRASPDFAPRDDPQLDALPLGRARPGVALVDPQAQRRRSRVEAARRATHRRPSRRTSRGAQRRCPGNRALPLRAQTGGESLAERRRSTGCPRRPPGTLRT